LRARRLDQPDDMPLGVYRTKKGKSIYLTGNKIAELLRKAVKSIRPDTSSEDLKRYSAHSLRVWACVLLDEAGKPTRLYQEEASLARGLFQDVFTRYISHPTSAC
jgi:hypothetical protein